MTQGENRDLSSVKSKFLLMRSIICAHFFFLPFSLPNCDSDPGITEQAFLPPPTDGIHFPGHCGKTSAPATVFRPCQAIS